MKSNWIRFLTCLVLASLLLLPAHADKIKSFDDKNPVTSGSSQTESDCNHLWIDFEEDGVKGKVCGLCGADYCETVGHKEKTKATCSQKAVCEICEKEFGELAPHTPSTSTSCSVDITCTVCGTVLSKGGEHDWCQPSCTTPKTCKVCGTVEGEKLAHRWGQGIITKEPSAVSAGSIRYVCEDCGEIKNQPIYFDDGESGGVNPLIPILIIVIVVAGAGSIVYFRWVRPAIKKKNGKMQKTVKTKKITKE